MLNIKIIYILILCLFIHCSKDSSNILIEDIPPLFKQSLNFQGTTETLDIITWNIENFSINNKTTLYVQEIIDSINVDIIALQEIKEMNDFNYLLNLLDNNWIGFRSGENNENHQELAYLININNISILEEPIEILPEYYYHFAYREPYLLKVNFQNQEIILINVHYKSDYDGNHSERRLIANQKIYNYINSYEENTKVIVLGDFNDELTDIQDNIFNYFLNDEENYFFGDMDIAQGNEENWSFPSWPSHIDHILITNELFNNIIKVETLLLGHNAYTYPGVYENNVSDHRPVGIQFLFEP